MTSGRWSAARRLAVCGLLGVAACQSAPVQIAQPAPVVQTDWQTTLAQTSQEVTAGRYGVADKLLLDLATKNPGTAESTEALYWRALYKLDPANPATTPHDAAVLLDSYLAAPDGRHRPEAAILRKVAATLEARSGLTPTTVIAKSDAPLVVADKTKDDEMQRLREELAKANAELDRIKRRLAQPKP